VLETLEASPEQPAQRLRSLVSATVGPDWAAAVPQFLYPEPEPQSSSFTRNAPPRITTERASDWRNRSIALSIGVDADARRISQALTEPEYLEAWISLPDHADDSRIIASKRADGYRLDQVCDGRSITSLVASFLFCHQRKMRLSWRKLAAQEMSESLVDFRIRGNFASSILEFRQTAFISADEYLWHQRLWQRSLGSLALILRSI